MLGLPNNFRAGSMAPMGSRMLTTTEAAEQLGVSGERVRQLIKTGRLPSQQLGRDHLIREADLKLVAERRPGRPPKAAPRPTNGRRPAAEQASRRAAERWENEGGAPLPPVKKPTQRRGK